MAKLCRPKIRNFSSLTKVINKRFLIIPRGYSDVSESFWDRFVTLKVLRVRIRQYFRNAQNWPISRIDSTQSQKIRIFSSSR